MTERPYQALQSVAMGLVIVFLDAGRGGWDWIADPLGWVLVLAGLAPLKHQIPSQRGLTAFAAVCLALSVLTFPPDSVAKIDESLGWLFSLPTIAFCFVLCDALAEVFIGNLRSGFLTLRTLFVVVAILPVLVYGADWEPLTLPTAVLAVATNVALVFVLWAAGSFEVASEPAHQSRSEEPDPDKKASDEKATGKQGPSKKPGKGSTKDSSSGPSKGPSRAPSKKPGTGSSKGSGKESSEAKPRPAAAKPTRPVSGKEVLEKVRRRRQQRGLDT